VNLGDAWGYGLDFKGGIEMTEELKPCPFCGGEAKIGSFKGSKENWAVWCESCCIPCSEKYTIEETIKTWNTRVQPAVPSVEEIERELNHTWYKFWHRMVDIPPTIKEQATAIHALMKGEK
jgi:hypothetical protein